MQAQAHRTIEGVPMDSPMNALVFAPQHNAEGLRADAAEFRGEAHRFCRAHGLRDGVYLFDNREEPHIRREYLYDTLARYTPKSLDTLALFCHGWPDGIQLGTSTAHVKRLALTIKPVAARELTVVLYCCSAGADNDGSTADERVPGPGGDHGFADRLRDALGDAGVQATVYAHSTRGHCTRNPYARVFRAGERAGGHWIVEPGSALWPAWRRALWSSDEDDTFRFRFPWMTREQLEAELGGVA
jgi:hypothetical protein